MANIVDETLDNEWHQEMVSITCGATQPPSQGTLEGLLEIELLGNVNLCHVRGTADPHQHHRHL